VILLNDLLEMSYLFFRLLMTKFMTIVWYHVGITTIAGGKSMRGGHIDGPSDDAKFSTDFEVRYIRGSCSLLVIDRGNQAILEIPLHDNDCAYQDEFGFPLGTLHLSYYLTKGYCCSMNSDCR
jgi:hypothetical protein